MNRSMGAIALVGGLVLFGSASTASALNVNGNRGIEGTRVERPQHDSADKRAFREQIRAKQREYRELRKANDPRAAQAEQEIRAMKDEWKRSYGNDEEARAGHQRGARGQNGRGKAKGHGKHNR